MKKLILSAIFLFIAGIGISYAQQGTEYSARFENLLKDNGYAVLDVKNEKKDNVLSIAEAKAVKVEKRIEEAKNIKGELKIREEAFISNGKKEDADKEREQIKKVEDFISETEKQLNELYKNIAEISNAADDTPFIIYTCEKDGVKSTVAVNLTDDKAYVF